MKKVKQEHRLGCGVAATASVLGLSYKETIKLFKDGKKKAATSGFYLKEIVEVLEKAGKKYEARYIKPNLRKSIYEKGVIVFIRNPKKYTINHHYLARTNGSWVDPWINYPEIINVKAGHRKRLPGKPIYAILPRKD